MAWSMHGDRSYDEARARWEGPPPGVDDRPARVHAVTALEALARGSVPAADEPRPR